MKFFQVGGCVRDEIMGVASKDIDFTVVLEATDFIKDSLTVKAQEPFEVMSNRLEAMGFKIFVSTPEHLTVRAQFPVADGGFGVMKTGGVIREGKKRLTADFVLARKEGTYSDGRRPDSVEPGTLHDDLARRDFTMNAIAKDDDGTLIDPFNGQGDIAARIIRAVGSPQDRLEEDALRAVRALRFSVTKGFIISPDLRFSMESEAVLHSVRTKISDERIKDELNKMVRTHPFESIKAMSQFPLLTDAMLSGRVSFDATMKTKGR